MSKVMLYRHPSILKSDDINKGIVKVKGVKFDWIIVKEDEVEACLDQGFYKTADEALLGDEDEETTETKTTEDELSLDNLKDKTADEIKDEYTLDQLRPLAKSLKIRGSSQMNEDKLVGKLLEKLGE